MVGGDAKTGEDGLVIEKLVKGGAGLGYLNGTPVFVPRSAPGDIVRIRRHRRVRGVNYADIVEVVRPSASRREVPCPWYGDCGGCDWMHLDYASQVGWKGAVLAETLARIGGVRLKRDPDVARSPVEWGWRHRARLQLADKTAGFFRPGSHRIVRWDRCRVLADPLNAVVPAIRTVLSGAPFHGIHGSLEIATAPETAGVTLAWRLAHAVHRRGARELLERMERTAADAGVALTGQAILGKRGQGLIGRGGPLAFRSGPVACFASPGTFFQAHPGINRQLVDRVLHILVRNGVRSLLDLFCGNGNFGRPAAAAGLEVLGVDGSAGAVADARRGPPRSARFLQRDVRAFLTGAGPGRYDAVIVDPPRAGLPWGTGARLGGITDLLLYVSCDPATLARDTRQLQEGGFRLQEVEALDMFPNSSHFETLAILRKGG